MANAKISALPTATELQGNEIIPLVQGVFEPKSH